ncbi:MAG: DUF368 domain-containing protein [Butyribacter sp.]|nr:DUF368 domain-containing protein [bacterium]MDY3854708.1 DUF368 domain-containing protein [Butyribacter sp.]
MGFLKDIIKGIIIGIANAIPGVSGGTMMVSMGIYDNIIYCITHLFKQLKKSIMTLMPYFIGMAVGIVGLAFAIKSLYGNFPFQTSMVFIGLILGGVPMLLKRVKKQKMGAGNGVVFLIFFAAIILMQCLGKNSTDVTLTIGFIPLVKMFFVGIVASATMVIPGVSGSMMLMIMGYYNPIMTAITELVSGLVKGSWGKVLEVGASLVPFGIGVVLGIFVIAKIIEILLQKWEGLTYSAILGLVVSSPVVVLMGTPLAGLGVVTVLTGVIALVIGGVVALKLGD